MLDAEKFLDVVGKLPVFDDQYLTTGAAGVEAFKREELLQSFCAA